MLKSVMVSKSDESRLAFKSCQPAFAEDDKPLTDSESINRAELHFARFALDG
jgi:hypothetical protein